MSNDNERIKELDDALASFEKCYKHVVYEIESRIKAKIVQLIQTNDEQVRGEIKAYQSLLDLPQQLQQERQSLIALPDEGAKSGSLIEY